MPPPRSVMNSTMAISIFSSLQQISLLFSALISVGSRHALKRHVRSTSGDKNSIFLMCVAISDHFCTCAAADILGSFIGEIKGCFRARLWCGDGQS